MTDLADYTIELGVRIETENGVYAFPSEDRYEAALGWYNSTPKTDVINFCDYNGFNMRHGDGLLPDWAERAMQIHAWLGSFAVK